MTALRLDPAQLARFAADVLHGHGVGRSDADTCAARLVEADLRGRGGHGVFRLPAYCERIRHGGLNIAPDIRLERETPVSALVDGDNGLGPVVASFATRTAIDKARASGVGWVGVRGSNHAGAAGVYTALIAGADLVGMFFAVANTNQLPPWGGTDPLLGTNPVSIAVPAGEEDPVVVDVATTVVSFGEIKVAAQEGRSIPEGWMMDRDGQPLLDPARAAEGFLLPIGGHKGYGLSLVIGLLAGVLNGARFGRDVIDHYEDLTTPTDTGQTVLALRADLFRDLDDVKRDVDRHARELRASARIEDDVPIRLPGERAAARSREASARGLPLASDLVARLNALAEPLGVAPLTAVRS